MTASAECVRLLVVRHGQQERDGHDGPLTALGRDQAADAAAVIRLAGNDRLVSSSLRRAVQTATARAGRTMDDRGHRSACVDHRIRALPQGRHNNGAPRHTFLARLGEVAHLPADRITGQ